MIPFANELSRADWHPTVVEIYEYWRSIRPADGLPGRQHVDPLNIPKHLLAGLWLLDVQREPFRLRYRLVGTRIDRAIGRDVTGQWLDEAHPQIKENVPFIERYRNVVLTRSPSHREGKPTLWTHETFARIENLLLPLARDGATVDMIMAYSVLFRQDGSPAP